MTFTMFKHMKGGVPPWPPCVETLYGPVGFRLPLPTLPLPLLFPPSLFCFPLCALSLFLSSPFSSPLPSSASFFLSPRHIINVDRKWVVKMRAPWFRGSCPHALAALLLYALPLILFFVISFCDLVLHFSILLLFTPALGG